MSERSAPTQPPLFLDQGRLTLYPDGEWQAFSQDNKSWTTGTLDSHDVGRLIQFLPILSDNALHLFDEEVTG
jgi:hypothetical protein